MKHRLVLMIGLTFILAVTLACGDEGSTPTKAATLSPSATPTTGTVPPTPTSPATPKPTPKLNGTPLATATPVGTPTPTPSVSREWNVEDIQVNGSTVTVTLHLFAGVDVDATLDGRDADVVREGRAVGAIEYIFLNVTPGPHAIEVRDVVGFTENADVVVPTVTVKEPVNGLCIPAAPLGVAVGDTWTIVGPIETEGDLSESSLPAGAFEASSTYLVMEIKDSTWSVGETDRGSRGGNSVLVEHSKMEIHVTQAIRDADGNVLETTEEVLNGSTISSASLSPVLTLDWECHRQAWSQRPTTGDFPGGGSTRATHTVGEKTLFSGTVAVLFLQTLNVSAPEQEIEITTEMVAGYDVLTGRLVLMDLSNTGVLNGEPLGLKIVQEIEPDGTVSTGNDGPGSTASWPDELVRRLEREPVANPPLSVTKYLYKGEKVYFVPQRCCDIFSDLYDADGNIIAHPDGGITGEGDGRSPDFFDQRSEERIIWTDRRVTDTSKVQVLAPIDSVEVLVMESFPPQYALVVLSGLPNGCVTFGGYRLEQGGDVIRIEVVNWKPADRSILCTEVYGTVETRINLGSDFESGRTYTIEVNDVTESFVAQ